MIAEQTASYSRLSERIHVARISDATGISPRRVREIANALEAARCIERVKSRGRYPSEYSLVLPPGVACEYPTMPSGEQGSESQPCPGPGGVVLPPAEHPTEKNVRDAGGVGAIEPPEFADAVRAVRGAPSRGKQRTEWLAAFVESPRGFHDIVGAATREGIKPAALLTAKIRAGEHLRPEEEGAEYDVEVHEPDSETPTLLGPFDSAGARAKQVEFEARGWHAFLRRRSEP